MYLVACRPILSVVSQFLGRYFKIVVSRYSTVRPGWNKQWCW